MRQAFNFDTGKDCRRDLVGKTSDHRQ
jgi:hypothetical protein